MLERTVLKRGLDEVQRLENATEKRNIRNCTITLYWLLRDIVELPKCACIKKCVDLLYI